MKLNLRKYLGAASVTALLAFGGGAAQAVPYSFTQSGFSGGGSLVGYFDGADSNGDGFISFAAGELSGFYFAFTGDSLVADFHHTLADLAVFADSFVYDMDGFIGNAAGEAIASNYQQQNISTGAEYGAGDAGFGGGISYVLDWPTQQYSLSSELVAVSIPEPTSLALLGLGFAMLPFARRRQAR